LRVKSFYLSYFFIFFANVKKRLKLYSDHHKAQQRKTNMETRKATSVLQHLSGPERQQFLTHWSGFLWLLGLTALMLWSCGAKPKYRIGVSLYHQFSWREKLANELEYASYQYDNVDLQIYSADNSAEKQAEQINRFVRSGISLLIVSPIEDQRVVAAIEQAYDSGVPVILVDNAMLTDKYTAYIGADNYDIGETIGRYVGHELDGHGRVVEIQGRKGNYSTEERHQGFSEALRQYPDIQLVASEYANWNDTMALQKTVEVLSRHNDVDLIFFHTDGMVNHTISRYANRHSPPIKLVGIDALSKNPSGIESVKKGNLTASFVYPTRGDKVLETALQILHGEPYERTEILPTGLVDRENLETILQQHVEIDHLDNQIGTMRGMLNAVSNQHRQQRVITILMAILAAALTFFSVTLYKTLQRNRRLKRHIEDEYVKKEEQASLLLKSNEKLQQLNQQIEEDAQTKMNFFTNISHEIRTPLTLVAGPVEALLNDQTLSGERRQQLLSVADKNIHVLLDLVNEILDFRKVQNGMATLKVDRFDLTKALTDWTGNFQPTAREKHISLRLNCDDKLPLWIEADRKKLTSIVVNLLSNAFKYTPEQGSIDVTLTSDDAAGTCCLKVRDSGTGISPQDLPRIFDTFYQSPTAQGGTGIGLSLAKSFVELHGGTITADSAIGIGTLFTISLPLRQTELQPTVQPEKVDEVTDDASLSERPSLLIIDDNAEMRAYVSHVLGERYTISQAANGQEGFDLAQQLVPDLIVCDVMMPVMDGLTCCRLLKTTTATSHIPVLMLTARSLDEHYVEGYDNGADGYLTKPFTAQVLRSRIENLLANRQMLRNLWSADSKAPTLEAVKPRESEFVRRFLDYIEEHLTDSDLSVEDLSEAMNLSRAQLYAKIKALTGRAPVEHLRSARLRRGRELLETTELSISEITYKVGFTAPSYFSKCFKDEYHISPGDVRGKGKRGF